MPPISPDPESAGFRRSERLGWGAAVAGLGILMFIVGALTNWLKIRYPSGSEKSYGLFDGLADKISAADGYSATSTQKALFPAGVLIAAAVVGIVGVVASIGVRRPAATKALRIGVPFALIIVAPIALRLLVKTPDNTTSTNTTVTPQIGLFLWSLGFTVMAIAAGIGPRIRYVAQDGRSYTRDEALRSIGVHITRRVSPTALVFAWLAAVGALIAYLAVPWFGTDGNTASFTKIHDNLSKSTGGPGFERAYFSWLGYVALVAFVLIAVLMTLGARGAASAVTVRLVAAISAPVILVVHLVGIDKIPHKTDQAGPTLVGVAAGVLLIAALVPSRRTVEAPSAPAPAWPPPAGAYPQPGQAFQPSLQWQPGPQMQPAPQWQTAPQAQPAPQWQTAPQAQPVQQWPSNPEPQQYPEPEHKPEPMRSPEQSQPDPHAAPKPAEQ